MSLLRCAWIAVLAFAASGCVLMFEDDDDDPPPVVDPVLETGRFSPALCTGEPAGGPTCPFNDIALDELGTAGTFRLVVQAIGTGLYLNNLTLIAGPEGLFLDHPTLRFWRSSDGAPAFERRFDVIVNLRPGESAMLDTTSFALAEPGTMSLRVEIIGPFRP